MPSRAPWGHVCWTAVALLVLAGGCANDPTGDDGGNGGAGAGGTGGTGGTASGGSGGSTGGTGGSGGTGTTLEYGECIVEMPGTCVAGLTCVGFGMTDYCVNTCTPPDGMCPSGTQICVRQYSQPSQGYCAERRDAFETCVLPGALGACDRDALCHAAVTSMPERCVPICDVGSLGDFVAVAACPDFSADLGGGATTCLPITIGAGSGSLCGIEVEVGEPCDQGTWRCNLENTRPDTDGGAEPAAVGDVDPGALACEHAADGARCVRICSADDGTSESPCACPAADLLCSDPSDPGLAWSCTRWPELQPDVWGCAIIEDCSVDATACDDNTASGWTTCAASPYENGPSMICGPDG